MLEQKVRILMGEWKRAYVGTHAASTAFFVFMSIIPLLILYVSLVPTSGLSQQEMALVLCDMVPDALDDLVTTLVNEAYEKSGLGFSLSLLTLFWTASQGASELRGGLNAMYDIEEDRNRVAVAAISIFFIVALLATLTFVLSLVFSGVIDRVMAVIVPSSHAQDLMMTTFQSIAVFAIGTLEFAACYTFLTAGKRGFRAQLPGAVLAAVA